MLLLSVSQIFWFYLSEAPSTLREVSGSVVDISMKMNVEG
jgi:hypothetical protein